MSTKINRHTGDSVLDSYASIDHDNSMMGNRLKNIMEREGVTAYRLWKDLHIDQGQLSRFLRGEEALSLKKLEQVAGYLGYDLELVKRKPSQKGE